jgi:DUF1365 family protein
MHSCIYEGTVIHRRSKPVTHQFQYRLFMVYLDLRELSRLVGPKGIISSKKYASRSFLRGDHLFKPMESLDWEVREIIRSQTGAMATGPIRMLTQLRYCGAYFSPLNLYYVYDECERSVEFIVAEVNNTPWRERHCYVLWDGNRASDGNQLTFAHRKEFHVSPFMGMNVEYHWQLTEPGPELSAMLTNTEDAAELFTARMSLTRHTLEGHHLRRMTLRYPLMTTQITAAVYFQAFKLWWKKCPFYPHPIKTNCLISNAPVHPTRLPTVISETDSQPTNGSDCSMPLASVDGPFCEDSPNLSQVN